MKKSFLSLAACLSLLIIVGCGGEETTTPAPSEPATPAADTMAPPADAAPAADAAAPAGEAPANP